MWQLLLRDVRARLRRPHLENAAVGDNPVLNGVAMTTAPSVTTSTVVEPTDSSSSSSSQCDGSARQSRRLVKRRRLADERFHAALIQTSAWYLSFAFTSLASPLHDNQDALLVPANSACLDSVDRTVSLAAPAVAFAVFDGHGVGGEASSLYSAQVLAHELATLWSIVEPLDSLPLAHLILTEAVASTNAALLVDTTRSECGSTLAVAVIVGQRLLHAHCGDSRILLLRNQRLVALTADHSANRADERSRVRASGGVFVLDGSERRLSKRIECNGSTVVASLGMTRGLGHVQFARVGVTARPEFGALELRRGDRVLLASDGVTDVLSSDALRKALANAVSAADAVQSLCDATANGRDDRSIVVINIDDAVTVASNNSK
jgi:serine/threonine protein phosphatase PrpC